MDKNLLLRTLQFPSERVVRCSFHIALINQLMVLDRLMYDKDKHLPFLDVSSVSLVTYEELLSSVHTVQVNMPCCTLV